MWNLQLLALLAGLHLSYARSQAIEWDVLIFTQQWPITSCIGHMAQKPAASCNIFRNMTSWTIHGIWPTKLGTIGPNYCNSSWPLDFAEIAPLESFLVKYWANIYADTDQLSLWQHEWKKHGTCAAAHPLLNTQRKYFEKGLQWVIQYDFVAALGKYNISPSDDTSYSRDSIFSAIKDIFGVNAAVDCIYNLELKRSELSQLKLCFDKQLKLMDCDGIIGSGDKSPQLGNCPKTGIIYPASVRLGPIQYQYPLSLVKKHVKSWDEAQAVCSSWLCHALMTIFSLIWLTL